MRNIHYYTAIFLMSVTAHAIDYAGDPSAASYHYNDKHEYYQPTSSWGVVAAFLRDYQAIGNVAKDIADFILMDYDLTEEVSRIESTYAPIADPMLISTVFLAQVCDGFVHPALKSSEIKKNQVQQRSSKGVVMQTPSEDILIEAQKEREKKKRLDADQRQANIKKKKLPLSKYNSIKLVKVNNIQQPREKR